MADDAIKKIKQIYRNKLRNNKQIQKYKEQILNGEEADRALNLYSQEAGVATAASLIDMSTDSEITKELLDAVLRENYAAVINASRASQASHNKETVTQLGSPDIGFDGSDEDSLMQRISEYDDPAAGIEAVKNALMLDSQKYSDQYMQRSAGFQSGSGMEVLISREYDGVGVHTTDKGGGDECTWCKERCGENVPYKEAYARGMFERHPGCGCIITYHTKLGTFRQGKGDWETNNWNPVQESSSRVNGSKFKIYHQKTGEMTPDEYLNYQRELKEAKKLERNQIFLPKDEYAHVMSELNTNLSDEERKHAIIYRAIGNYRYYIINKGFDDYVIIGKEEI